MQRNPKESEEGVAIMCRAMEEMRNQALEAGRKEAVLEMALRMLHSGRYALKEIAEITALPLEEVKLLSETKTA